MIIDYKIEQTEEYILVIDLTYKPKIKSLNIQITTPKNRVIDIIYYFKKVNIFGKNALGNFEKGNYIFSIGGIVKTVKIKSKNS